MLGTPFCGLIVLAFGLMIASSVAAEERYALLIGNAKYDPDKVGELKNPLNDITVVGKSLDSLHFKTWRIENADFKTMHAAIQAHAARVRTAGPNTISFVYYSGHGAADPETDINYLIPIDVSAADETLWQNSIELKAHVVDLLVTHAPNAMHFIVVDACRNELKLRLKKTFNVDGKTFVPVRNLLGSLLIFSTAAKRTASDLGEGSGPYARVLAEEIVKPGVESVTMFRSVAVRVLQSAGQYPLISEVPPFGEVYFAGKTGASDLAIRAEREAFDRERGSVRKTMQTLLSQIGSDVVKGFGAGIIDPLKKWPKTDPTNPVRLRICFMDGNRENTAYVARIGRQWTLYGGIDFDFGSWSDPRQCSDNDASDIRISFEAPGYWSYIGIDAQNARADQPTLNLQALGTVSLKELESGQNDPTILHEFGHVLGFVHGWAAGEAKCESEFDWGFIYEYSSKNYGWTEREADNMLRSRPITGS
jgi:Caspase domain